MASVHPEAFDEHGRPLNGAAARLSELFEAHGRTVQGLCRLLLRDREEAEDAAQQSFLSAYGALLRGSEPRHPAAWLATIARNECWARTRQRMREPLTTALEERDEPLPDPVAEAAQKANLRAVWIAIGDLPRSQREALLLREFSGLSYEELADALAVSTSAVESLLFRARRQVQLRTRPVLASINSLAGGSLAKLAGLPVAGKLAAGAVGVALVTGGAVAIEVQPTAPVGQSAARVVPPETRLHFTAAPRPVRAVVVRPATPSKLRARAAPTRVIRRAAARVPAPSARSRRSSSPQGSTALAAAAPAPPLGAGTVSGPAQAPPEEPSSAGPAPATSDPPATTDSGSGSDSGSSSGLDSGSDSSSNSGPGSTSSGSDSGSSDLSASGETLTTSPGSGDMVSTSSSDGGGTSLSTDGGGNSGPDGGGTSGSSDSTDGGVSGGSG